MLKREGIGNSVGIKSAVRLNWHRASKGFAMVRNAKLILIWCFTICVISATAKNCTALPLDLGAAGPEYWTVLEVGSGTISQSQSQPSSRKKHGARTAAAAVSASQQVVTGNVGISQDGHLSSSGGQFQGDLYLGNDSAAQFSGSFAGNRPITGMAHLGLGASVSPNYSIATVSDSPDSMLDQARIDATAASATASALASTSGLRQINLNRHSLTLSSGVYNVSALQLTRSTLTLSGSGSFVFNISSVFALKSARILLAGGATEANVLFNYTGTRDVTLSRFSRRGGASVLHGIVLALNARVNLAPGLVVGEIISGRDIALSSSAMITSVANVARTVPVPETTSTFVLILIALGVLVAFWSFSVSSSNKQFETSR
jgi:Ice-binding-like